MARIIEMGGLSAEWTYPYRSYWGENFSQCNFSRTRTPPAAKITNFVKLPSNEHYPLLGVRTQHGTHAHKHGTHNHAHTRAHTPHSYGAYVCVRVRPQAIITQGPIAISVDASSWSSYETGVYNGCNQTNPDIDHAVQVRPQSRTRAIVGRTHRLTHDTHDTRTTRSWSVTARTRSTVTTGW
jgi:cathepsin L